MRSLFRLFFCYPFKYNSSEISLYYYWKVTDCLAGCFAIISLIPLLILESFNLFAGVFRKNFYPFTIIGKLQAVCWGISRKFYKKFFLLNQGHANRKVDRIFKILFSTITFSAKITPLYSQGHEFSFCNRFVKFLMNFRKKSVRFRLPK